MRKYTIACFIGLALVLAGCGQKHKAQALIGSFVEENTTLGKMHRMHDRLDSTYRLTDSLIVDMHRQAARQPQFNRDISYGKFVKSEPLLYQRVRFTDDHDTLHITFYMNRDLTQVVACKEN